jgi:uncharacterized protein (TIGR02246 family)
MPDHGLHEIHRRFAEAFNAGNLDGLMKLYEPDAVLVSQTGEALAGTAAIREALGGFLALKGTITLGTRAAYTAGDVALLYGEYTLKGTGPDGNALELSGRTSEVIRRGSDGVWRYVVDNPNSGG